MKEDFESSFETALDLLFVVVGIPMKKVLRVDFKIRKRLQLLLLPTFNYQIQYFDSRKFYKK
jgi:hypothetical protein